MSTAEIIPSALETSMPICNLSQTAQLLLRGKSPVQLAIPGLRQFDIAKAHQGLLRFDTEYDREQQQKWEIEVPRDSHRPNEKDDGFIRKSRGNRNPDDKIYLHYRYDLPSLAFDRDLIIHPWMWELFGSCRSMLKACTARGFELARAMDRESSGFDFYARMLEFQHLNVIRILLYDQESDNPEAPPLADSHTDRDAITNNIASSRRGFVGFPNGKRVAYSQTDFPNALTFTGDQLEKITAGSVPAFRHAVEGMPGSKERRWAIVCFLKMDG